MHGLLTLVILLNPLILVVVDKLVGTGDINKKMGEMPADEQARRKNLIATIILYLLIAYSIFLPLENQAHRGSISDLRPG